jgi:predicted helicase
MSPILNLKSSHKPIKLYYQELAKLQEQGYHNEGQVRKPFDSLLDYCCRQFDWLLATEVTLKFNNKNIRPDGIIKRGIFQHGIYEAKDNQDKLQLEITKKFKSGYPKNNALFWSPQQIIIYQNNKLVFDEPIDKNPDHLILGLKRFFEYAEPEIEAWEKAADEFGHNVQSLAEGLLKLIDEQLQINLNFITAFKDFVTLCQQAINPNISEKAVQEMLIQHLLTERIFRKLFNNSDFINRNIIAAEIEKVITALTCKSFNRDHFLGSLDYFYNALENAASTVSDFSEKQAFLNQIYEKFFQSFSQKTADTHGIVYTPQPIVNFMVKSVQEILQKEFNTSLADSDVKILDPFVGTGNFILRVMREIAQESKLSLPDKYAEDLHCNEVMLLPYYIACLNIEHEYYELTGKYEPYQGICFVDTFELAESKIKQLSLFTPKNTERVQRQKDSPIFVIIGNPPYNVGQVNENDNNKNRKYEAIDKQVKETYSKDSKAGLRKSLADVYVKAFRFASDRIGDEGIVCFVSNNSFIDNIAFDGMRKHLAQDFNQVYVLDLKGNVRKDSMREGIAIGEKHTVFGLGAMVGISITFLIKKKGDQNHQIFYYPVNWKATRSEKFKLLDQAEQIYNLSWKLITPNSKYTWLTDDLEENFDSFICLGDKQSKAGKFEDAKTIFHQYSLGVSTNRDTWVYNFNYNQLSYNVGEMIKVYNYDLFNYQNDQDKIRNIDHFVTDDPNKISWSEGLKKDLKAGKSLEFSKNNIRKSLYRPFVTSYLYFADGLNDRLSKFPLIFPTTESEKENLVICFNSIGNTKNFHCLAVNIIPDLHLTGDSQCFPFYIYDEEGNNRTENITDYSLQQFRDFYQDQSISKWEIFYYVYAILHHPEYRRKYAANLKRELPRIPTLTPFKEISQIGEKLGQIHVNYEEQKEYRLKMIENPDLPVDLRVEKMKLSPDKTQIVYNEYLTLTGIPPEVWEYKLGNKSALDWIIDQYQIKTDKRSGIINDPNRLDDEMYIIRLIKKIVTVSVETVKLVAELNEYSL